MRTLWLLGIALVATPLAALAADTLAIEAPPPCPTTDGAKLESHRDVVLRCWSDWRKAGTKDEVRGKLLDTLFLEQSLPSRIGTFFSESMKFGADGGVTNTTGRNGGPGQDLSTPARFDQTEWVYSLKIGWQDKPIFKDFWLLTLNRDELSDFREDGKWRDPSRWALLDAVTMTAVYSYGSTITDPDGDNNFTTKAKGGYEIKAAYTLPLENIFEGIGWTASFHE